MTPDFYLKQDDELPVLTAILKNGEAILDLTDCTVVMRFRKVNEDGAVVFGRDLTVDADPTTGSVTYQWVSEDTEEEGEFEGEFVITYPDGSNLTVPNDGYFNFTILAKLA